MCRLYNEGDIRKLAKQNAYDIKRKTGKPLGVTRRIPAGSVGVGTYYYDKATGILIAYFHHYEDPQGKRITKFDPKILLINGIQYHLPKKGDPIPARIGNEKINQILHKTGWRAKLTYAYHISEQAMKLYKEQIRNRLVKWGILESREWALA